MKHDNFVLVMNNSKKYRIGLIFFITLLVIVITVTLVIKVRQNKNLGVFQAYTIYRSANGLQAGYRVRFNGINVGLVDGILILNDTTVRVNFSIDTTYRRFMHKNLIASIGSSGLMGDNLLDLTPGQGSSNYPLVQPGDFIKGKQPADYSRLLKRMQATGTNFAKLGPAISEISKKFTSGNGTVAKLLNDKKLKKSLKLTVKTAKETITTIKGVKK